MKKISIILALLLLSVGCSSSVDEAADDATTGAGESPVELEDGTSDETEAGGALEGMQVGFTMPTAQNVTIQGVANGLRAEIEREGAQLVTVDNQLDIDKQIADIDQLITQGVDALVVWPLDPSALVGVLERAEEQGILILAHDAVLDASAGSDELGPIAAQVLTGREHQAAEAAKYIRQEAGEGANVVGITIGPPVPTHLYLFEQFEQRAEEEGLNFLEKQGNPSDDAAGARPLMENMLTVHSDIDAVYTYNDPSAIGAATAAEAAGRLDDMMVLGYNAGPDGIDAVNSGLITATWDYKPVEIGQTLGELIPLMVDGQDESDELQRTYVMDTEMYDSNNISEFVPWDDRVAMIEDGEYIGLPVE